MDIGLSLKNKRKLLGIPLERVHKDTKISLKFLEGIENNDYSVFPAELYLFGSIKKYCAYLGVESADYVSQLQKNTASSAGSASLSNPADAPVNEQEAAKSKSCSVHDDIIKGALILLGVLGIIAAALYVFGVYVNSAYKSSKEKSDGLYTKAPYMKSRINQSYDLPDKLELRVSALEKVWILLGDGSSMLFEGFLNEGREVVFTTHTGFTLFAGKPGGISMRLNSLVVNNSDVFTGGSTEAKLTKEYFKELRRLATLRGVGFNAPKVESK